MPNRTTIRYAAKLAYQLGLMRGIYESHQCGLLVSHDFDNRRMIVMVGEEPYHVPIAKSWLEF